MIKTAGTTNCMDVKGTIIWGETPQTPLSVFDVGFAHVRGRPPKTPQIVWMFRTRLYGGETPQTPLSVFDLPNIRRRLI